MKLSRRTMLRGVGGATLALPLLESTSARADVVVPKRLFVFVTGEGTLLSRWTPPTQANDALTLSQLLQPLAPHKSALTVISGLSNKMPSYHHSNGHNAPGHTLMTAGLIETSTDATGNLLADGQRADVQQGSLCMGPSFDHELARRLGVKAPLNLAVADGNPGENRMWYQVKKTPGPGPNPEAPMATDPVSVFRSQLGGLPTTTTRADRLKGQRRSVLDAVRGSLSSLAKTVSAADKARLEAHADRLSSLEARLAYTPPLECGGLVQQLPPGYPTGPGARPDERQYSTALIDVAVQALACGSTQIATLQFTNYDGPTFPFLPSGPFSGWHAQVHGDMGGAPNDNPNLIAGFTWYATQFNTLLRQMSEVNEPNGRTLLDNSLVLWLSEFGNGGQHSTSNLPVVIAGSLQGTIRTDRHLARSGLTTGDLFSSLFSAYGVDPTGFGFQGDSGLNHGGITGF